MLPQVYEAIKTFSKGEPPARCLSALSLSHPHGTSRQGA